MAENEDHMASRSQPCADASALALKACPFCGGRAEIQGGFHATYVMCLACGVMGPNLISHEELAAAWNARSMQPEWMKLAGEVAGLESEDGGRSFPSKELCARARQLAMSGDGGEAVQLGDSGMNQKDPPQ